MTRNVELFCHEPGWEIGSRNRPVLYGAPTSGGKAGLRGSLGVEVAAEDVVPTRGKVRNVGEDLVRLDEPAGLIQRTVPGLHVRGVHREGGFFGRVPVQAKVVAHDVARVVGVGPARADEGRGEQVERALSVDERGVDVRVDEGLPGGPVARRVRRVVEVIDQQRDRAGAGHLLEQDDVGVEGFAVELPVHDLTDLGREAAVVERDVPRRDAEAVGRRRAAAPQNDRRRRCTLEHLRPLPR
jgi:hypothetical protein